MAGAVITLFVTGEISGKKTLDERLSLRRKDKIPYGTFVAFNGLSKVFPRATVKPEKAIPGYWKELDKEARDQALVIVSTRFAADEEELESLAKFVSNGNDVFISAVYLSSAADKFFEVNSSSYNFEFFNIKDLDDEFRCTLSAPPFTKPLKFYYPGRTFSTYFSDVDTATSFVLGRDYVGRPNFIQLRLGGGNFFVHLEPLAFSNYFLLHRNNMGYFDQAMSLLKPGIRKIVWDEYYIDKKEDYSPPKKKDGWFRVLMRYPAFRAALLTAFLALLVFVLLEMRRKQRMIPVIKKPRNESLDFVKTIGRLYYDRGDHRNLGRKMSAYFLEHVRNRYKLATNTLDAEFTKSLHYKSGIPENEIQDIIHSIREMEQDASINSDKLTKFHKKLEAFYKKS